MTVPPEFWTLIDRSTDCWLWQGTRDRNGYARLSIAGVSRYGHRLSYEAHVGPVPEGLELDHLCRVRHCVNPAHLEAVTHRENMRRSLSWAGLKAAQTACKHGHPLSADNVYLTPNGRRRCRECNRINCRARLALNNERRREKVRARRMAVSMEGKRDAVNRLPFAL